MDKIVSRNRIRSIVDAIFGVYEHKRRRGAIADMVWGVILAPKLSITAIGRVLAWRLNVSPKNCIRRVDRFVGNHLLQPQSLIDSFARWLVEKRKEVVVSLDWTEYGKDRHHRLAVNLVTSHGRATPLLWQTYEYGAIKDRRSKIERDMLRRLKSVVTHDCHVIVLADRGFIDRKLMTLIKRRLKWDYVIRLRASMQMEPQFGVMAPLYTYRPRGNRAVSFSNPRLTARGNRVASVVIVKDAKAKEPWYLASSIDGDEELVISLYRRRFTCEEHFRDEKDTRFGLGTKQTRCSTCERRDRMLLVNALATVLLTLLGAVGEKLGYDRMLRANTVKKRTHSLFRQGREYAQGVILPFVDRFAGELTRILRTFRTVSTSYGTC